MNFIDQFITYLLSQKKPAARLTIKNYKADIRHFIVWFEKELAREFNLSDVTPEVILLYKQSKIISVRSMERHISSLRKFFSFLKNQNIYTNNPFETTALAKATAHAKTESPWKLTDFKNYLYVTNTAAITIKNYISDIDQFLFWLAKVCDLDSMLQQKNKTMFDGITKAVVEEYKQRLIKSGFSPRSVNRKLSSLRKYLSWAQNEGYLANKPQVFDMPLVQAPFKPEIASSPRQEEKPKQYAWFPPMRLAQKTSEFSLLLFDAIISEPLATTIVKTKGIFAGIKRKPLFFPIKSYQSPLAVTGITKEAYAPLTISTANFPLYKKILHNITYKRPKWYNSYQSNTFSRLTTIGILALFIIAGCLLTGRLVLDQQAKNQLVLGLKTNTLQTKKLSFQGKLMDTNHTPITKTATVTFLLYNDPTTPSPVWEESQTIQPANDGTFTTTLGATTPIARQLFSDNDTLFLGVQINGQAELLPREQIANVQYAQDSQTLKGLPVITQPNTSTQNVILALDSSGNLTIGKKASPIFQATGGDFTLLGQSVILSTIPGSNGDIQLAPAGTGTIDVQKPIQNTSQYSSKGGVPGAVEIADLLSVVATSSSQSAFTINQNDAGPIISASRSGTAKFTIENNGTAYIAGNLGIGTANPIAKLQVNGAIAPSETNTYDLGSPSLRFNTLYINSIIASSSGTLGFWQRTDTNVSPSNVNDGINIGASDTTSAIAHIAGQTNQNSFIKSGNVGIGTANPNSRLTLQGTGNGTNPVLVTQDSNGNKKFMITDSGNVGIGNSSPNASLAISGNAVIGFSEGTIGPNNGIAIAGNVGIGTSSPNYKLEVAGSAHITGTIYASDTTVQAGDLAEDYVSSQILEAGDVVAMANDGNNAALVKTTTENSGKMLGVISTKPGITLNSDAKTDTTHPYTYPLALIGRVPVKVITENGPISVGDAISVSSIPGFAAKATQPGYILGRALEPLECLHASEICQGKIMAYVSPSWFDPNALLTTTGDITFTASTSAKTTGETQQNITLLDKNGSVITRVGAFAEAIIGTIRIGMAHITTATIDSLSAKTIISPIAEIDKVKTNLISPLSDDADIAIALNRDTITIQNASGAAVAQITNKGDARFNGTLTAQSLSTNDASISGILRAKKIIVDDIENTSTKSAMPTLLPDTMLTNEAIASYSGQLSLSNINATFGKFTQGLFALGPTSLTDTTIFGTLHIGKNLSIADESFNVIGGDIAFQPLRQGGVSFLSGLIYIDTDGNLSVINNATFGKDVSVHGTLSAGIISPLPDSDLTIALASHSATSDSTGGALKMKNASGSAVLSINSIGDIIASGSATIKKLNLDVIPQAIAISDIEAQASGSAGVATISANRSTLTITNPQVTEKSLIYITPRDQTDNQVLFLLRQTPNTSFTVGLQQPAKSDVPFNWLIVN